MSFIGQVIYIVVGLLLKIGSKGYVKCVNGIVYDYEFQRLCDIQENIFKHFLKNTMKIASSVSFRVIEAWHW